MHINANTTISIPPLLLIPYLKSHVPTYHSWMQDPALRAATASELLTLDEEYAMQASWRQDADKLTFIIARSPPSNSHANARLHAGTSWQRASDPQPQLIGDVNLFLNTLDDSDDAEDESVTKHEASNPSATATSERKRGVVVGEIEIMIASAACRGQGYGGKALEGFLRYVARHLDWILVEYARDDRRGWELGHLRAKIQESNMGSIALFEGRGFERVGGSNWFGEVEVRLSVEGLKRRYGVDGGGYKEVKWEGKGEGEGMGSRA